MDFTEINSRGKRGELLGRIDRYMSRFRTAKTIIIKFGLHASFVELESAKNALNELLRPIVVPYAAAVENDVMLMDDNCRPHRYNLVDDFLFEEGITNGMVSVFSLHEPNRECL
ncbi:uncharacterized protein TNCV_5130901 [Trichonephila clavipes]|nr:uncharacterized protein TNCV_5130901 [Trichonephila clavipes]